MESGGSQRAKSSEFTEDASPTIPREQEQRIIEAVLAGDKNAYRELVERNEARMLAVATSMVGNFHDAQDLVQQAFVKAYFNLQNFRGQSSFYTWVFRILYNLNIDLSRKSYRRAEIGQDDPFILESLANSADAAAAPGWVTSGVSQVGSPEQESQRGEIRRHFGLALAQLSEEHRRAIILREIEGMSYAEISEAMQCSKGTVMSRLHHARRHLQRLLGDLVDLPVAEESQGEGRE